MDNFTTDVAAARLGAASLAARSPWTNVVAAGANHALGQSPVLAAGSTDARPGAPRPVQAQQIAPQRAKSAVRMAAELPSMTNEVTFTRKPNNVHKTRISVGGYGAMGPHPEREPEPLA